MANPRIQLGRGYLQLFLEMLTQRVPANRFVASVPDDQTDVLFRDPETWHHLDVFSLLIPRPKCRPSSRTHNHPRICIFSGDSRIPEITCSSDPENRPKLYDRRRV